MGKLRSSDEPVGRMAKLMAELYYFMAEEREGSSLMRSPIPW
jgi:hypothetical protein